MLMLDLTDVAIVVVSTASPVMMVLVVAGAEMILVVVEGGCFDKQYERIAGIFDNGLSAANGCSTQQAGGLLPIAVAVARVTAAKSEWNHGSLILMILARNDVVNELVSSKTKDQLLYCTCGFRRFLLSSALHGRGVETLWACLIPLWSTHASHLQLGEI